MEEIKGEINTPKKAKKTSKTRFYNAEWENMPEFRGWLGQSEDEEKGARCKLCQKNMRCHIFDIKKHAETKKHRDIGKGNRNVFSNHQRLSRSIFKKSRQMATFFLKK